jgi:hypothetical protein
VTSCGKPWRGKQTKPTACRRQSNDKPAAASRRCALWLTFRLDAKAGTWKVAGTVGPEAVSEAIS